ncbi:hypothetical protein [Psychromonas ingrahamii]|uniref:hypothetical protein n=1 Tax=Psychromonas ingrahamii TaxID=357794 RepID=UPI0000D802B5|nr:hypothetical protein [Psychromonas ingrahamii]
MKIYKVRCPVGLDQNITRWVRTETQTDSRPGSKQSTLNISERAELEILRKENNRLKMERDILKKAAVFFANEK